MKTRLFIAAALCSAALTASAQTEKGKNLIGGTLEFAAGKSESNGADSKSHNVTVGVNYGYFVAKNIAIGVVVGYTNGKQTSIQDVPSPYGSTVTKIETTTKSNGFSVGPLLRHYIDLGEKFKFQNNFMAVFSRNKSQSISANSTATSNGKSKSYFAGIKSGFAFLPTKRFSIDMMFDIVSYGKADIESFYDYPSTSFTSKNVEKDFKFGLTTFNPTLGVNFHF